MYVLRASKTPAPCQRQGCQSSSDLWSGAGKLLRLVSDIVVVHASSSSSD